MMMIIIVTRMSGTDENEFQKYFPDCNCWAIKNLCQQNSESRISNDLLSFNDGDNFLIVDGFAISNDDNKADQLKKYIITAKRNGKIITIHIHPGVRCTLNQAIQIIFGSPVPNIPENITIKEYSQSLKISFDANTNKYSIDTSYNPPKKVEC